MKCKAQQRRHSQGCPLNSPWPGDLSKILYDMSMKMMVRDNFVHGDLHGGNILYSENDDQVTVLDAGIATSLDKGTFAPFGADLRFCAPACMKPSFQSMLAQDAFYMHYVPGRLRRSLNICNDSMNRTWPPCCKCQSVSLWHLQRPAKNLAQVVNTKQLQVDIQQTMDKCLSRNL